MEEEMNITLEEQIEYMRIQFHDHLGHNHKNDAEKCAAILATLEACRDDAWQCRQKPRSPEQVE